jgi:Uma2 family endonuclease
MSTIAPAAAPPARSAAPPDVPDVPIYRLSVPQYHAMIQQGILTTEDRVELLRGWLVPKMTKNAPHPTATGLLLDVLFPLCPVGWLLRIQDPITLSDSEPEPDAAVVRGNRRDYAARHPNPAEVGLVIEAADSSLDQDRNVKKPMYAEARIPTYWIVNLIETVIEVYTDPSGPSAQPDYANRQDFHNGDEVPLILDGREIARIPVSSLLP